ncbi:hypothetical protein BJF92_19005 [Rhizobium rhizosphaerae]|uniref:Uncharacterized protein n=1 Tax=Xaviernesmea rhizosphaerae TaxID=1672749 RepID=A0A1Q9ADZ9_9HYPH|nr:hypothetical protein [Xaviernesmea rhizosphaerae]OLP53115.1 hypothetical protein BJF92_19005 [Xaviernesmea rhizosphaerae]OQP87322.1 hypothetical protein BTR14_05105 [Xaviernesmea rhizosphaerae]
MTDQPIDAFAAALSPMTEDELFTALSRLERESEKGSGVEGDGSPQAETLARIALVEEEVERRYPGQLLAPYRAWKSRDPLLG